MRYITQSLALLIILSWSMQPTSVAAITKIDINDFKTPNTIYKPTDRRRVIIVYQGRGVRYTVQIGRAHV